MKNRLMTRATWVRSLAAVTLATTLFVTPASAGICEWLTGKPAAPPVPYGPPIYTPNPNPPIVGYGPTVPAGSAVAPAGFPAASGAVPAASLAPTLNTPPANYAAPPPSAYSPPPTTYGANYAPVNGCPNCAPAVAAPPRAVTNYVPPTYRTNWVQVPVTTYRPVVTTDPVTGLPVNGVLPCTTYQWQARREPTGLFSGWFGRSTPPAPVAAAPVGVPVAQPVVTGYAPQGYVGNVPVPITTNYAYAPTVRGYAPATGGCASGTCPSAVTAPTVVAPAPYATFPSTTVPAPTTPLTTPVPTTPVPTTTFPASPPSSFPAVPRPSTTLSTPRMLNGGTVPADVQPQLDPRDLNRGGAFVPETRNYAPVEVNPQPVVPVESQKIDLPPPPVDNLQSNRAPIRQPAFVPLGRTTDQPTSAAKPESKLRLVPDPDAQPLELRKHEIPQLISPDDRTTQNINSRGFQSVPIAWPAKANAPVVVVNKPAMTASELSLVPALVKPVPTSIPAVEHLDDSGWKSIAR